MNYPRPDAVRLALFTTLLGLGTGILPVSPVIAHEEPPVRLGAATDAQGTQPDWVRRSNQNAELLTRIAARFSPEGAGRLGVEGTDEQVADLQPRVGERRRQAFTAAQKELETRLAVEKDPLVRQDLEILIRSAREDVRGSELDEKYLVPYFNTPGLVFGGLRSLLDDQVAPARRSAALVRLRRYAGLEAGYTPITELAQARIRERLNTPGLLGPSREEVERDLNTQAFYVDGIPQLFDKYKIEGYKPAYEQLKQQLTAYSDFVRKEVLPKARTDFRQPPELYAFSLSQFGVDIPPEQLIAQARSAFKDIQQQMQALAPAVAKARGLSVSDYREVIRALKKDQLVGDAILPHYQQRLGQLEEIIRREKLVTLPTRPARIRLATDAESAASPAPNMRPPRLLGNTGEQGEFVLPLNIPAPPGAKAGQTLKYDDFTFSAASWTLTAHEARPGHELQFAALVEKGVSVPRAIYAFNSTNVEGWGLYSEAIARPFMPAEGQLISLQFQLLRAARAYLDPELQLGKITPAQANRVLREDVVLSEAMANQEVERYTVRSPGQATSYFYGFTKLIALRQETEKRLGKSFDARQFHDFILAQGLLPPNLLRQAVLEKFLGEARP